MSFIDRVQVTFRVKSKPLRLISGQTYYTGVTQLKNLRPCKVVVKDLRGHILGTDVARRSIQNKTAILGQLLGGSLMECGEVIIPPQRSPFFSCYVEASYYNKYLVLYNPSNLPIDLKGWRIELQVYSETGTTYTAPWVEKLDGIEIQPYSTFVFAERRAEIWKGVPGRYIQFGVLSFSGNDPVKLFNNRGELVDVIGYKGQFKEFGRAVTLKRKKGYGASVEYEPNEWERYPEHTVLAGGKDLLSVHEFDGYGLDLMSVVYPSTVDYERGEWAVSVRIGQPTFTDTDRDLIPLMYEDAETRASVNNAVYLEYECTTNGVDVEPLLPNQVFLLDSAEVEVYRA